jgi:hypothetical protein
MNDGPLISVVLPVYNAEKYVREAVESVLSQTFSNFELIVINDGSTDGSGDILRELAAKDQRIVLVDRPNRGLVSTLNEGIALARADLIARMDADDVALPERFAEQYRRMSESPTLGVIGSFISLVDAEGKTIRQGVYPISERDVSEFLEAGCPFAHPTVLMRREAVLAAGGYRKAFSHAEDYDLWLRIHELGYGLFNLPKPLLKYRIHDTNVSLVHREQQELATVMATLCHRMRVAKLPDPSLHVESVGPDLIDAIPFEMRKDVEASLFVIRHARVSLGQVTELESAWQSYRSLDAKTRSEPIMADFLLRLLNGAVRRLSIDLAFRALISAIKVDPKRASGLLLRKMKIRF